MAGLLPENLEFVAGQAPRGALALRCGWTFAANVKIGKS